MSGSQKIVIIGGGVAGPTAGVYGQLKGYETEIIEMHTVPGGQCTAWERLKARLPSLWTNSYFVSTVGGAPLEVIKQYIEQQKGQ